MFKFIDMYSNNIMALDICAASKSILESFFGKEVNHIINNLMSLMNFKLYDFEFLKIIESVYAGKIDNTIWGCRHKLSSCKYNCKDFIDRNSKYISDKYEPINEMVIF